MPEKQKTRTWKNPKTIIAAAAVTVLLTLWNTFATNDRQGTGRLDSLPAPSPSVGAQPTSNSTCTIQTQTKNLGKRCMTVTQTRSS